MTATDLTFRYSNGEVAASETAKAFSWEAPVPVNSFWDAFEYCTARSFLCNFSAEELRQLPIDPDSTDIYQEKAKLLLKLLQTKLAEEESASWSLSGCELFESDYNRWYDLWQAVYAYQNELNLPEAEETVRMLVARNRDKSSEVRPRHMLAEYLVKNGGYKEAEDIEFPVCAWMDARPHLGKESPQAINARRILVRALWGQGQPRRHEAEELLAEIEALVDGMADGKFGVYQQEERRLNELLKTALHEA
jgi:hypothetical protein